MITGTLYYMHGQHEQRHFLMQEKMQHTMQQMQATTRTKMVKARITQTHQLSVHSPSTPGYNSKLYRDKVIITYHQYP